MLADQLTLHSERPGPVHGWRHCIIMIDQRSRESGEAQAQLPFSSSSSKAYKKSLVINKNFILINDKKKKKS